MENTIEERIKEYIIDNRGYCDRQDIEDFKRLIHDIAHPKS